MTDAQLNHLATILVDSRERIKNKYVAGVKEHGGNLWQKEGILDMAIDEAIDQVVYLLTLKQQLESAAILEETECGC